MMSLYDNDASPVFDASSDTLSFYQSTFLKGKPKILGIVMIATAILQVGLGIASAFTTVSASFVSGLPFYGPVFYIVAGSLTLSVHYKLYRLLMKASLVLNIISTIFSFTSLVMVSADLYVIDNMTDYEYYIKSSCTVGFIVLCGLLITNLLICSVAATLSVFGFWSVGHVPVSQMFVVNEDAVSSKSEAGGYTIEGNIGRATKA